MARTQKRTRSKPKQSSEKDASFHAFWSGSLSFGLVNVPVLVFPATRHSGVRLRMIGPHNTPLERRFYCPRDGNEVVGDDIVRGFELDDGSYIIVSDEELADLEPQKTREIDLRAFVDLSEIAPAFLERGYYLTPTKDATKAYRLLAEVMEKTGRAGIATFVMRDREYLVAIFAKNGILLPKRYVSTTKFVIRAIGLPEVITAPRERIAAFERSINVLHAKTISRAELVDQDAKRLLALIEKKKRGAKGLIRTDEDRTVGDSQADDEVDLLATIRQSLRHVAKSHALRSTHLEPSRNSGQGTRKAARRARTSKTVKSHRTK